MPEDFREIQTAVERILNVKTSIKRKKRSESEKKKELFVAAINMLEETITRSNIMTVDFKLDFFQYDEKFMQVIDSLFYLSFGSEGSEIIAFYLYDRVNEDGSINPLTDLSGQEIRLETPLDLWNVLVSMNTKLQD